MANTTHKFALHEFCDEFGTQLRIAHHLTDVIVLLPAVLMVEFKHPEPVTRVHDGGKSTLVACPTLELDYVHEDTQTVATPIVSSVLLCAIPPVLCECNALIRAAAGIPNDIAELIV